MQWKLEPSPKSYYAVFYGIPCYFVEEGSNGCSLQGRNYLTDLLITPLAHLHNYLIAPFDDRGFPVKIGPRVDGSDAENWGYVSEIENE